VLPDHVIDLIDAGLKGRHLVPAAEAVTITRSLPHGTSAPCTRWPARWPARLLGPAGRQRDLALALIISRVAQPGSKLSTLTWWADTTLGATSAWPGRPPMTSTRRWTGWRPPGRDRGGAGRRHLGPEPNPSKMALFDLSSSWLEGSHCPLAARGYSRDGKKGKLQIEYGLLTDPKAARSRSGSSPAAPVTRPRSPHRGRGAGQVRPGQDGHGRRPGHDHQRPDRRAEPAGRRNPAAGPYGWITALRAPAVRKLMATTARSSCPV